MGKYTVNLKEILKQQNPNFNPRDKDSVVNTLKEVLFYDMERLNPAYHELFLKGFYTTFRNYESPYHDNDELAEDLVAVLHTNATTFNTIYDLALEGVFTSYTKTETKGESKNEHADFTLNRNKDQSSKADQTVSQGSKQDNNLSNTNQSNRDKSMHLERDGRTRTNAVNRNTTVKDASTSTSTDTSTSVSTSKADNKFSNTPQNALQSVEDGTYLSNFTLDTQNTDTRSNGGSTNKTDGTHTTSGTDKVVDTVEGDLTTNNDSLSKSKNVSENQSNGKYIDGSTSVGESKNTGESSGVSTGNNVGSNQSTTKTFTYNYEQLVNLNKSLEDTIWDKFRPLFIPVYYSVY